MTRAELIIALCREAGDSLSDAAIVAGWEANHCGCCSTDVAAAAEGDSTALIRLRLCMGLPILT